NVERRTEEVARGFSRAASAAVPPVAEPERNALPEMIEEILPFYSESSVRLRELVHDTTADGSWEGKHRDTALLLHVPAGTPQSASSSRMPLLFERLGLAALPRFAALALAVIAVAGLLVWVIRFVLYKIFVVDVMEPLWSGRSNFETDVSTPNLFVVSNSTPADDAQLERYCVVDFVQ